MPDAAAGEELGRGPLSKLRIAPMPRRNCLANGRMVRRKIPSGPKPRDPKPGSKRRKPDRSRGIRSLGSGSRIAGSEAVGSEAVGSEAVGSEAVGSEAVGSEAVGSEALGSEIGADESSLQGEADFEGELIDGRYVPIVLQRWGFIYLFVVEALILLRLMLDPLMVRRPLLDPNLTTGGLNFIGISLFIFMMANVVDQQSASAGGAGAGTWSGLCVDEHVAGDSHATGQRSTRAERCRRRFRN